MLCLRSVVLYAKCAGASADGTGASSSPVAAEKYVEAGGEGSRACARELPGKSE